MTDPLNLDRTISILTKIRGDIEDVMKEISQNEGRNDEKSMENRKETSNRIMAHLLELRSSNRESHLALDERREAKKRENSSDRQESVENRVLIDGIYEEKRALAYEKVQMEKIIRNLRNFSTKFENFEMISEEEFLRNAGEELKNFANEHEKMLNRFTFETQERKKLCTEADKLKASNSELKKRNEETKKMISNIQSKVKTIQLASSSLQEFATTTESAVDSKQIQMAKNLPSPLYLLYFQASQLKAIHPQLIKSLTIIEGNDGSADNFPMFIEVNIPSSKSNLVVHLTYHNNLQIIIVRAEYEGSAANEILVDLFGNDNGRTSPNPLHTDASKTIYKDKRSGRAYKWAQPLAGISFLPAIGSESHTEPSRSLESIIKAIQDRTESRINLETELSALTKGELLPSKEKVSTVAAIKGWKDVTQVAKTKQNLDSRIFKAIYTDSKGETVEGHVEVKPNYPALGSVRFEFQASPVLLNQKIEEILKRVSLVKESSPHLLSDLVQEVLQEL